MSFQIFLLVGNSTNLTRHNLLTDNTLKKIAEDVLVGNLVTMSNQNDKLAGCFHNLVRQYMTTDCNF